MTPAERLRTAAERLEAQSDDATTQPWVVRPTPATPYAYDVLGGEFDLLVTRWISEQDARLIATLRPLAVLIAAWLQDEAVAMDRWLSYDTAKVVHEPPGCGFAFGPAGGCDCFDRPLAVADAVLAATGGAS